MKIGPDRELIRFKTEVTQIKEDLLPDVRILTGTAYREMAVDIGDQLGLDATQVLKTDFLCGEYKLAFEETLKGTDLFVFQTSNDQTGAMDAYETSRILYAASGNLKDLHLIYPNLSNLRQEMKYSPREEISAPHDLNMWKGSAPMLQDVFAFDPHTSALEAIMKALQLGGGRGLTTMSLFYRYIQEYLDIDNITIQTPDEGRSKVVGNLGKLVFGSREEYIRHMIPAVKTKDSFGDKTINLYRPYNVPNWINSFGRDLFIFDDMIDNGGTMRTAAKAFKENPELCPNSITCAAPHGIFSENAAELFQECEYIDRVIVTNTMNIPESKWFDKLQIIDISSLIAEIIARTVNKQSFQDYFSM